MTKPPYNNILLQQSRKDKYRYHRRRAKFLLVPTVIVNAVLAFAMFAGTLALLARLRNAPTLIVLAILCRWIAKKIRWRRSMHRRLAAGYAQLSAEEVLKRVREEGRHFVLFLRGFDLELKNVSYDGINIEVGSREAEIHARPIEALLIEMLNEDVPLIALTNPRVSGPMEGAYRFETVPANWKQFIEELLPEAALIILHLTSLSEGILDELELLNNPLYLRKTAIIVGRNLAFENGDDGKWFQRMLHQFDYVVFQQSSLVWSPQQERQFHSRLLTCLQEILRNYQDEKSIVRVDSTNFTLTTLYWPSKLWDFMKGPMLGSLGLLLVAILLLTLTSPSDSTPIIAGVYDLSRLIGTIVLTWVALSLILACLKGIDFILESVFSAIMRPVDRIYYKVQNALDKRANSIRRSIARLFK